MTKPKLGMISLLLISGAAVPWLIQRQSDLKTINSLQTQLHQLTEQRTGDESSSNRIAQAVSPLPNDQLSELLKLRGEVGVLRGRTNELLELLAENRRLPSAKTRASPQGQPDLVAGDVVPVESLTFAGYATPEATFQSTFSAMSKGDFKTAMEGLTGDFKEHEEKEFAGKSATELAALAAESSARFGTSTVQIVASGLVSDDQARLVISVSSDGESFLRMRRIDGVWKITSVNH